jgi:hypothetical protein
MYVEYLASHCSSFKVNVRRLDHSHFLNPLAHKIVSVTCSY